MAWSGSGLFAPTWRDILDASQLAVDLTAEDHKAAFWGASITPNFSSDTAYGTSPWDSGESSGSGYSTGGIEITGTTLTINSGVLIFDADDFSIPDSTITAEGYVAYADALADELLFAVWFGSALTTNAGTFSVTHSANGIVRLDLVP